MLPRTLPATLCLLLLACSGDDGRGNLLKEPGGGDGDAGAGDGGKSDGGSPLRPGPVPVGDGGSQSTVPLMGIELNPKDSSLESLDGSTPQLQFETTAVYEDGTTGAALGPRYEVEPRSLGSIDAASGLFVANGLIGGEAVVRVYVPNGDEDLIAETTLTVTLKRQVTDNVAADVPDKFNTGSTRDPARMVPILYPLDGAVMPQNVFPADIQWDVGNEGDAYRLKLVKTHMDITVYVEHTGAGFLYHHLPDGANWRALSQSDPAEAARLRIDRWDSAADEVILGDEVEVTFAQAALTGTVYYWDINATRIMRVDDGTNNRVSFMPTPPLSKDDGANCVGCHSVSRSGRYMVGRIGPGYNIAGVFDLTQDLTGDPPTSVYPLNQSSPYSIQWWFSSWNPDDTRLVVTTESSNQRLAFVDPMLGSEVTVTGSLPVNTTHPDWSPDGASIAYVADPDDWGGQNAAGNIAVLPVTGTDTVGAAQVLHQGGALSAATEGGNADSYPSFSPDSQRIAFAHGTTSRSDSADSALYLMQADGSDVVRLDTGLGGSDTTNNYQPRFSPFQQGGYYWLSFLSKRTYGNEQVGSKGANPGCIGSTGPSVQQVWVMAVRDGATPGEDASSVPYWLPGQDPRSCNISAYWAPRPCRPDGESCTTGAECCGGDCLPGEGGALVCSPPPPDRCRNENETCSTAADCCVPEGDDPVLECIGRVCAQPPPECLPRYGACEKDTDCCSPLKCLEKQCDIPLE